MFLARGKKREKGDDTTFIRVADKEIDDSRGRQFTKCGPTPWLFEQALGAVHIVRTQRGGRGVYKKRADACRGEGGV